MKKEDFLREFRAKLSGLSKEEIDDRVSFYGEMIEGRMAEGASEEEAVAAVGPIDVAVARMMAEIPLTALVRDKVKPKNKLKTWEILLLIFGFPIWLPLLIAFLVILFALYIVLWSLVISFYAVDFALVLIALAGACGVWVFQGSGNTAGAMFYGGAGMACLGLAILLFMISTAFAKGAIKLTGKMLTGMKTSFLGKGANA